jgi:uncharacterized protein YndB with AHSA1/START domain
MTDVNAQVAAVARDVHEEDHATGPLIIQVLSQQYASPIEDVWDAVTTGDRIARWFLPVSGDLRLGGRYQLEGNAGGEVLECSPPANGAARYRITWEYGGGVTWVVIRLAADGAERTRVELEHTTPKSDIPAGFWEQFGPGATGVGWDGGMLGLALHLSGRPGVNPEAAAEWPFTDEGRAFYRAAADAWRDAHVAAGADADSAAKGADATFAFYTGASTPG